MFATLQDRLVKELKLAGITEVEAANRFFRDVYLADHNGRFAIEPAVPQSAFVPLADRAQLREILCVQEERVVAKDNTVCFEGLTLQLPQSPLRHHYVKARVGVHQYPDGALAVFHGLRPIGRYTSEGVPLETASGSLRKAA